jgi:hypothetical protein
MRRKFLYILFLLIFAKEALAQGFDWQYSSRLPSASPTFFIGLTGEYNHLIHSGSLDFTEAQNHCATYTKGIGEGYSAGIRGEYWLTGLLAVYGEVLYVNSPGNFTVQAEPLPRIGQELLTEYNFNTVMNYFIIEPGIKYRLFDSHFHAGLGVQIGFLMNDNSEHKERIIGPTNAPKFPTNPPSYERIIYDGKISSLNTLFIEPRIQFGYDITYGTGKYATPKISLGIPVFDLTKSSTWKRWALSVGITIYLGI